MSKVFLDTNLWIYLYSQNAQTKATVVQQLIEDRFEAISVSTQVLGEMFHVLTRKHITSSTEAQAIVVDITATFNPVAIGAAQVLQAIELYQKYAYSYWDSLILATAIQQGCTQLYSEDMQHNQTIEATLTILNPFHERLDV